MDDGPHGEPRRTLAESAAQPCPVRPLAGEERPQRIVDVRGRVLKRGGALGVGFALLALGLLRGALLNVPIRSGCAGGGSGSCPGSAAWNACAPSRSAAGASGPLGLDGSPVSGFHCWRSHVSGVQLVGGSCGCSSAVIASRRPELRSNHSAAVPTAARDA